MGERAPRHEQASAAESTPLAVERPAAEVAHEEQAQSQRLEAARNAAAAESTPGEAYQPLPVTDDRPYLVDRSAKLQRMRQNLSSIQSHLSPREQSFSRFIHKPVVSRVSEAAGKTVSRPSGLLGGGIAAFIGSLAYLLAAYRLGFTYNFSMFIIFFVGGFMLGILGEYVARQLRRRALIARLRREAR